MRLKALRRRRNVPPLAFRLSATTTFVSETPGRPMSEGPVLDSTDGIIGPPPRMNSIQKMQDEYPAKLCGNLSGL